jgi:hypothetical protein
MHEISSINKIFWSNNRGPLVPGRVRAKESRKRVRIDEKKERQRALGGQNYWFSLGIRYCALLANRGTNMRGQSGMVATPSKFGTA